MATEEDKIKRNTEVLELTLRADALKQEIRELEPIHQKLLIDIKNEKDQYETWKKRNAKPDII